MGLEDRLALLTGADAHGILDGQDEQLAVADRARAGVPQDHLLDHAHVLGLDHALELELRPQVHGELRAAVVLGDRLLPARALHLGDRDAREARLEQIGADRLEGLVPDVGDDHLHAVTSPGASRGRDRRRRGGTVAPAAAPPPISDCGMNCSG